MSERPRPTQDSEALRKQAEQKLSERPETGIDKQTDIRKLIHELQVYQIELEMQNGALQEARSQAETALDHYTELFDSAPIAYFILGEDGTIHQTNLRGTSLLAPNGSKLSGHRFVDHVSPECKLTFDRFLQEVFAGQAPEDCEITLRNGPEHRCVAIQATIANASNQTCLVTVLDITEKKHYEETIRNQADFDPLTELPNRRLFNDRLQQAIVKSHRKKQKFALMFLDLDHFKSINDTLGHDIGDSLLKEAARRLKGCIRETDTLARPGGDEFTLILADLEEPNDIDRVASNILQCMTAPFELGNESCYVSVSIGIALYPDDAVTAEELLKKADQSMYASKRQGRNRFCYFTPNMQAVVENRLRLTNDLRDAITDNQFWLAYQPIVELATGAIQKAEALIRWQHPTLGLLHPAQFISIAEDTGIINEIGDWVFQQAAHQIAQWRAVRKPHFQISINKSVTQFHSNNGQYGRCMKYLRHLGLPGDCLIIEITEGVLLNLSPLISDKLLTYRDGGIQVALDDFGTGYSSLASLKKFGIGYLKIDRSFVAHLTTDYTQRTICEATILMAHTLDIKVIAEGIESTEQRDLLMQMGCDYGQGYLFSKPIPATEFDRLLQGRETHE